MREIVHIVPNIKLMSEGRQIGFINFALDLAIEGDGSVTVLNNDGAGNSAGDGATPPSPLTGSMTPRSHGDTATPHGAGHRHHVGTDLHDHSRRHRAHEHAEEQRAPGHAGASIADHDRNLRAKHIAEVATSASQHVTGPMNTAHGPVGPVSTKPAPVSELAATPGRHPDIANVDPRLRHIVAAGARHLPEGYKATINEGYNPGGHVGKSQHHIKGRGALDVQITDPSGRVIPNEGGDPTGMYHRLAKGAYTEMLSSHPELKGRLAWGGAFGASRYNKAQDLMHFDIGGSRGAYTANRLENLGADVASATPATVATPPTGGGNIPDRNLNPGDIGSTPWSRGLPGASTSTDTDTGHHLLKFDNPEHGWEAMERLARNKYEAGMTTANQLIAGPKGWTPGKLGPGAARNVAAAMGKRPDEDLELNDPARMHAFKRALAIQEGSPQSLVDTLPPLPEAEK